MLASFNTLPFHIQQSAFNPTLAMKYFCVHSCLLRNLQRAPYKHFLLLSSLRNINVHVGVCWKTGYIKGTLLLSSFWM